MARKQRTGVDRNPSNQKIRVPDSCDGPMPEENDNVTVNHGKVFNGEKLPKGSDIGSPSVERVNRTKNAKVEEKSNHRSRKAQGKEKPGPERVPESVQSTSLHGNPEDLFGHASATDVPKSGRSEQGAKNPKDSLEGSQHSSPTEDGTNNSGSSDTVDGRNLEASALYLLEAARGWLEKQKPFFITITTILYAAGDYIRLKTEQAYPVVWGWLVYIGNIMLLISMVWLDCSVRGFVSFLCLGTTSFFAVIWCSVLSIIAMVGIVKFLIVMAVAALVAGFVGFTLAVVVASICATVLLWMYGSIWTTGLVIFLGGLGFALRYERVALLVTTIYAVYCVKMYVGWLGLLLGLNLSFFSSDLLVHFLKSNLNEQSRSNGPQDQAAGMRGQPGSFFGETMHASSPETSGRSTDRSSGVPSTSGGDADLTSGDEVLRLLNCTDHYSAFGFSRYEDVDISILKREYRKKAMLVHPDKNMGNEKAAEAFKRLQNAYEVLLDSFKRKAYDDELRREELLNWFRRSQNVSQNGRYGVFSGGFSHSGAGGEDPHGDSRRIACKKCGSFHIWIHANRSKSRARWCQDCKDFHQAKDGDGWVEQSSQPFLFGLLQKVDPTSAYICAESRIYDATEWFICQGMRCPANTHKPSFHVNTSVVNPKHGNMKGSGSGQRGAEHPDVEEIMTEEEFLEWLQKAMQSGIFEATGGGSTSTENPSGKAANLTKTSGSSKKKKKGKKQW